MVSNDYFSEVGIALKNFLLSKFCFSTVFNKGHILHLEVIK